MARKEEERSRSREQGRRGRSQSGHAEQERAQGQQSQQESREGQQKQMESAAEKIEGAGLDLFTTVMQSQKAFSDTLLQAQSEVIENWISATKHFQVSFLTLMTGERGGGTQNEVSQMTDSWRMFMHDSYKVFNDGVVKMQEGWKGAIDKQMEIVRDLAQKGTQIVKTPQREGGRQQHMRGAQSSQSGQSGRQAQARS